MRLRTKLIEPNHVKHSYYVTLLRWLGEKLWDHAEAIIDSKFNG